MTARTALLFLLIVGVIVVLIYVARAAGDPAPPALADTAAPDPTATATQAVAQDVNAFPDPAVTALRVKLRAEHTRYLQARRRVRQLHRVLMHQPSVREAIQLACMTYGSCSTLWRRASCESGLSSAARNRWSDASGLFQFLPSTFASTPFGALSIWSPYANALAAGWMEANGRGGEWICR